VQLLKNFSAFYGTRKKKLTIMRRMILNFEIKLKISPIPAKNKKKQRIRERRKIRALTEEELI
jgi:hypothetical protein